MKKKQHILPIALVPDPILREVASPWDLASPAEKDTVRGLAQDMIATMKQAAGVGIAGPQVHIQKRIFIALFDATPHVFINPEITRVSWFTETDTEGCLSIPGVWGQVKRYKGVRVRYTDEHLIEHHVNAQGFFARIIQHEMDHLNGILFIDKARDISSREEAV